MRTVQTWQSSAILNHSPTGSHFGFDYSLNPYRGCSHACRYCYARESHQYLDLGIGEDFERVLFVKENLPDRLGQELKKIPLSAVIAIGTVTDPYQPLEGRHHLTRHALQALTTTGHAFTITTKSPLVERDLDLLAPLGQRQQGGIHISLITLDKDLIHQLEPGTASPERRLTTMRQLTQSHIPLGAFLAPIIPGLTDYMRDLDALFNAIKETGANWVMTSTARLSPTVKPYFLKEVESFNPDAARYLKTLYGNEPFVPTSYRRQLSQRLDALYQKYHLSRSGPTLIPYLREQQISFSFD